MLKFTEHTGFYFRISSLLFFNKRNDQRGGSLENRLRLSLEIVREVKKVVSEYAHNPFVIGCIISPEEMPQKIYGLPETFILMNKLIEEKIDYLHFSLLDAVPQKPIDSEFSDEPISVVIKNYVNNRVPVVAGARYYFTFDIGDD